MNFIPSLCSAIKLRCSSQVTMGSVAAGGANARDGLRAVTYGPATIL